MAQPQEKPKLQPVRRPIPQAANDNFSAANDNQKKPEKKMQGIGFWLIVVIALFKDFLDFVLTLTVLLIPIIIPLTFLIGFGVWTYLYLQGVKMDTRKVATMATGFFLDAVPLFGALPIFTVTLFIIKFLENSEHAQKLKLLAGGVKKGA